MSLTATQLARAATLEADQQRLLQLSRMSNGQLYALLGGNPAEAAVWIRSAAQCGLPAAQLCLGRLLLEGRGLPRDGAAAYGWFLRAAERGNAEAMNMLGRCHENGWGVPVDLHRAAASYRAAAEAGHDWGQYNLGNLLFDGRGVSRDLQQALCWYLRAAQQGHGRAMNLVGRCLEEGWGCARSWEDAGYWYRCSAESGYFRGQFNHAATIAQSQPELAAQWYWKAATGGDAAICYAIVARLRWSAHPALRQVAQRVRDLLHARTRQLPRRSGSRQGRSKGSRQACGAMS